MQAGAGSDLAAVRAPSKATERTRSSAEDLHHYGGDMANNIIHLVLARTPTLQKGVRDLTVH